MDNKLCFVRVEFENDPNVKGYTYWYVCKDESVKEGDYVVAPLGRHNNVQTGTVRKVLIADETNSPYPVQYIKCIREVIKRF
ncbi:MAG: hypothetical protein K2L12_03230 [Clostridia bacterium]|nr:hypothetical protein [Clostridia bacterium]